MRVFGDDGIQVTFYQGHRGGTVNSVNPFCPEIKALFCIFWPVAR